MRNPSSSTLLAIALIATLASAPGCSTMGAYATPSETVDEAERQIFGDIAAHEFSKQLQVRLSAKLAVADVTGDRWNGMEQRRLVRTIQGLGEDSATYTDVVSLGAPEGATNEQLREEAARHHADLELIVLRREAVHAESSGLSILKLLIVPMLFVPTEENNVRLTVRAMVRDVRNGVIYTTFDEHIETRVSSSLVAENAEVRRASDELFERCVARMRESLARKLASLEHASN
jgi:hypothetical protein